jgi:hypothetical protein
MKIKPIEIIMLFFAIIFIMSSLTYIIEIGIESSVPRPMELEKIIAGICLIIGLGLFIGFIIIKITDIN